MTDPDPITTLSDLDEDSLAAVFGEFVDVYETEYSVPEDP